MNEPKLYLFFCQIGRKNIFRYHRTLEISVCYEMETVENHCSNTPGRKQPHAEGLTFIYISSFIRIIILEQ